MTLFDATITYIDLFNCRTSINGRNGALPDTSLSWPLVCQRRNQAKEEESRLIKRQACVSLVMFIYCSRQTFWLTYYVVYHTQVPVLMCLWLQMSCFRKFEFWKEEHVYWWELSENAISFWNHWLMLTCNAPTTAASAEVPSISLPFLLFQPAADSWAW